MLDDDDRLERNLLMFFFTPQLLFFFFNDTATTEIYTNLNTLPYTTLFRSPMHVAVGLGYTDPGRAFRGAIDEFRRSEEHTSELQSHSEISYAVFCLKKK